ncbi:PREDICTED: F-box protein SNE-like [Nicotiana attenuata]|uniref:F-box protein SNE-like n=1 Tax=Nicotiana attenuata TaxID=49451 RepID=UPI000905786B|nr:PREDICTED: F-box protein SNE-like [Nicotiana attenuata]
MVQLEEEGENEHKGANFFINDNIDVLIEILQRLHGGSLGVAACVCRLWCSITRNDSLWEHLCFRHVSLPPDGVKMVVLALGGYRRLVFLGCGSGGGSSGGRLRGGGSGGAATTSLLMFLCNAVNV